MPSMPLFFWNDEGNRRYQESYFDMYPGVWRHGDWMKVTARGSTIITGRSDSTLNRMGVRIGSSEIYSVVEDLPEVVDSLIIGYEMEGGQYYMPLFVVLEEGVALDAALKGKIRTRIRNTLSPRHVPDDVFAIREVPRTLNGKKLEVPIKKILMGVPLDKAVNLDSMANRDSVDYFVALREDLAARG
jgi:acetoacetyl-CoA synthetase